MVWLTVTHHLHTAQGRLCSEVLDMYEDSKLIVVKRHCILLCGLSQDRLTICQSFCLPFTVGRLVIQPCLQGGWLVVPSGQGLAYALREQAVVQFEARGNLAVASGTGVIIAGDQECVLYVPGQPAPPEPPGHSTRSLSEDSLSMSSQSQEDE